MYNIRIHIYTYLYGKGSDRMLKSLIISWLGFDDIDLIFKVVGEFSLK